MKWKLSIKRTYTIGSLFQLNEFKQVKVLLYFQRTEPPPQHIPIPTLSGFQVLLGEGCGGRKRGLRILRNLEIINF